MMTDVRCTLDLESLKAFESPAKWFTSFKCRWTIVQSVRHYELVVTAKQIHTNFMTFCGNNCSFVLFLK